MRYSATRFSVLALLRLALAFAAVVVVAAPVVAAPQSTSGSSEQVAPADAGSVTPQQKYCPPGDPTCFPFPINRAPLVSWTQVPSSGEYVLPTDTVALGVSASDPDGSVEHVVFYLDSSQVSTDTTSPYTAHLSNLTAGSHSIYAVAMDNDGRTTATNTVTFYVRNSVITGYIDSVSSAGVIKGWACSTYLPQSIHVDVYVGGTAGGGGTFVGRYLADESSGSPVDDACHVGGGSYRYLITLSAAKRQQYAGQAIYVYGLSPIGATNLSLTHSGIFTVPPPEPPSVSWSITPVSGQYFLSTSSIPLGAYANSQDGADMDKVQFILDGHVYETDTSAPYRTTLTGLSAGTHTVYVKATDDLGVSASTGSVVIKVRDSVVTGQIDGVSNTGLITGWACSTWLPQSINVDVYVGGPYGTGTYLGSYTANQSSEAAVAAACDVASGSYRYRIQLTQAQRQSYHGDPIYIYGLSPIGGSNNQLASSGSYTVPAIPPQVAETTTRAYDELGRVIAVYDSAGTLKASYVYDANGNVTKVTDGENHATTMTYDALGRVITVADAAGGVTHYTYDTGGRVKTVTDPRGNTTSYTYDGFGQLWERNSPDTGITTWSYAADGQLQGMERADHTLLTYTYDSLGRPTSVGTGSQTRHVAYDHCTHGAGRVCSVSDATGTTAYTYNAQGDVATRTFTIGATSYALGFNYDSSGRIAILTYPDGNQARYHYQYGRLSSITAMVNGSSKTVVSGLTWRAGDRLLASWTAGNGLVNTYTYDSNGRLTGIHVPGIQSLSFTYDAANRITSITNGIHSSLSQAFTYDDVNRLIGVTSPAGNQSYTYDANGNRTSQHVNGVTTALVIQPGSNHLASVGGQAIGYNADGNMVSRGGVMLYQYDSFNRLHHAGGATFYINPEGQRLRKTGTYGTTYFAPDRSGRLLADDQQGTWKDYVWMGSHMVGMLAGGTVYTLHGDQTGRVLAITGPSGNVAWAAKGLAFDRDTTTGNPAFFRLGFPGQYWDVEDSLWHNGYRDYDPTLGRYIESDPSGLAGGLNTYAYVANNPISAVDILGLCPKCQKPPKLPPGASVKANIERMLRLRHRVAGSGSLFGTALFSKFLHLVNYGGKWDYKTQDTYRDEYDAGGNFNYGAAGAAAGISTPLLRFAAAMAQIKHGSSHLRWIFSRSLGDQPRDVRSILAGIAYFQCLRSSGQL